MSPEVGPRKRFSRKEERASALSSNRLNHLSPKVSASGTACSSSPAGAVRSPTAPTQHTSPGCFCTGLCVNLEFCCVCAFWGGGAQARAARRWAPSKPSTGWGGGAWVTWLGHGDPLRPCLLSSSPQRQQGKQQQQQQGTEGQRKRGRGKDSSDDREERHYGCGRCHLFQSGPLPPPQQTF